MKNKRNKARSGAALALILAAAAVLFTACPEPASNLTSISSFVFPAADNNALAADITAVIDGASITAAVPAGTNVTALKAAVEIPAGASISPDPSAARDYTAPVSYTVTAADGVTTAEYTVTVTAEAETPGPGGDSTAPSPGTLSVRSVGLTAVMMEWTAASDAVTAAGDLEYRLFYSTSNNISTAADAEANGTAVGSGYAAGITTATATGLAQITAYYFAVVVQDEAGNKAAYTPLQQGTRVSVIESATASGGSYLKAVAAEGPFVYLAGDEYNGSNHDWRIEKRRLDTGALVEDFGTDGVIQDGLAGHDQPVSMLIIGDYLFVSGYETSEGNQQWRTQVYNKTTGAPVMGKKTIPLQIRTV